jgi:hypothetical protein
MPPGRLFYGWSVTIVFAPVVFPGSASGPIAIAHEGGAAPGSRPGGLLFELTGGDGAAVTAADAPLPAASLVGLAIDAAMRGAPPLPPVAEGR